MWKLLNTIDKKAKTFEGVRFENKEEPNSKCYTCGNEFFDAKKLKEHMSEIHPIKIQFRHCPETFEQNWKLEMHLKDHLVKRYKCEKCCQEFHL